MTLNIKNRSLKTLCVAGIVLALSGFPAYADVAGTGVDPSTFVYPGAGSSATVSQNASSAGVSYRIDYTTEASLNASNVVSGYAKVTEVALNPYDPTKINITVDASALLGQVQNLYLFDMKPYEMDLNGRSDYLSVREIGNGKITVTVDLFREDGSNRIYDAFVLAVPQGDGYYIVSNRCYISNPEAIAADQTPALNLGKKGLMVDPNILDDAIDLNIKHAFVAITTSQLFGQGINYTFEGKTYSFDSGLVNQLDQEINRLSSSGIAVTAGIVNGWNAQYPDLYRPGTAVQSSDAALYYGFNVETEDGFQMVKALASFLANRYNGHNSHGKITNWVIGNEINNQYWNYVGNYSVADYTRIFQRTFRVFYTAIKSVSANDNVMFSLDYYWTIPTESGIVTKYPGKDVLDTFASLDAQEGRTNWALAIHPYPYPLTDPVFWDDESSNKVTQDVTTPVVSYLNLGVLTNYMHNGNMLDNNGAVRNIFMTEQGFSSVKNLYKDSTTEQAAAVAYGHYIVENNPDIDAYMLSRQLDNEGETKDGLYFGLSTTGADGSLQAKPAREVFKYIDDPAQSLQISDFAKSIIGINDWSEVIPGFHL
ncbi:DUF5722 domain-containing protein [Oribacterium sp. WCC10]|uniref:DUF5722 domain-containing protein n=1 Tax=Oribacterium sp. WCC10 TaxID=1855343 RepID=UPI0008EC0539|nr:DUF5722 domain-containing protein [Oribacterium sp. WCC10]SFG19185.1 hypothetical protein SAMN05216356_10356 [Oribacterium sp. WCC10]